MGAAERRRWMRAAFALVAASAIGPALSGCDPAVTAPAVESSSSASATPPSTSSHEPAPEAAGRLSLPRAVHGPTSLSADRTAGLVPRLAAMRTDGFVASARWATPPGTSALGDALTARVSDALRGFAAEHGAAWAPGVDLVAGGAGAPCAGGSAFSASPTRLRVDCAVVVASGTVVGERLVIVRSEPGSPSSVVREVWYADASSGALHDGAALYAEGTEPRVLALVAEALRAAGRVAVGADPFAGLAPDSARPLLTDSAAGGNGVIVTLVVPGAERTRPDSVHVPWRLLEPFLSDAGRVVRSAAASGEGYAPPTVPAAGDPVDCTLTACASLTFDDGPGSRTPALLDVLDRERVGATFFVQGTAVARNPDTAVRTVASGHEIANHTWAHPNLTKLKDDEVRNEVRRAQAAIAEATGVRATSLRPPYGASDRRVRDLVALPFVVWDVDTRDWQGPGVDAVVERAVSEAVRGSIILMHDTHEDTVEAVPAIIDGLRGRGFALVAVADQFDGALPGAGALVSHGPR